jgi:hypothetical protein
MALAQTIRSGKMRVYVEDPDTPGTFVAPCGLTSKNWSLDLQANDDNVPDCDDPDALSWVARTPATRSAKISGTGVFDGTAFALWRRLALTGASFRCRVEFDTGGNPGGGYYQGYFIMNSLGNAANIGQRVQASVDLSSDGEVTWTDAA